MSEGHRVARAARSLVADRSCEIVAIDVREIIALWYLTIWDLLGRVVFFAVRLNFFKGCFELVRAIAELFLLFVSDLRESDTLLVSVAVVCSFRVSLGQLARVCLP